MQNSEIMVSIICNVYNHERYIREALDSFIMQKTNFAYEVLVHDDASTDHSADIIREYEKKYPDIIKPVYQTTNQYTKCNITLAYQVPRVKGKYVAFCEGDDYWNDPYKLQKQFNELENHPEIDMCAHAAEIIQNGIVVDTIAASSSKTVFDTNRVIRGGGGFVATNSLFYRATMYENVPEFYKFYSIDYLIQIWGSLRGGILFLPDCMSTYRRAVSGSWTDRVQNDKTVNISHKNNMIKALRMLDTFTDGQYHTVIIKKIISYYVNIFFLKNVNNSMISLLKGFRKWL